MIKYSCDICASIEDKPRGPETIKQLAVQRNEQRDCYSIQLHARFDGVYKTYNKDENDFDAHICLLCRIQMLEKLVAVMKDRVTTKTT